MADSESEAPTGIKDRNPKQTLLIRIRGVIQEAYDAVRHDQVKSLALSESPFLRFFSFSILYFAQGVPQGVLFYALPAWLAMNGKSPLEIGQFIAVIGLPWSFKILAAPLMDRFTYKVMGRRRPWILFGQMGLVLGFILMSTIDDPLNNMSLLMTFGFALGLFGIFQDIAVDGLAIDVLPVSQQARANGLMWGSKAFGTSITVAVTTLLFSLIGFQYTLLIFSFVVFLIMIVPAYIKERRVEKRLPWSKGKVADEVLAVQLRSWSSIFTKLFRVFVLPSSLLLAATAFFLSAGRGLIDATLPVFTVQELGWTDTEYSQVFATTTMIGGLLGMFLGGAMIDFLGKIRMFTYFIIFTILVFLIVFFFQEQMASRAFNHAFFLLFYTLDTFMTITLFALGMQLCLKKVAATQFTLYMTFANIGLVAGAWLMGELKHRFDWDIVFLSYVGIAMITLVVVRLINLERHDVKLKNLDEK